MRQDAFIGVALFHFLLLPRLLAAEPQPQGSPSKRPPAESRIVRIEYGSESGMCYGYCYNQTTIEERMIRSVSRTNYSLNGNRDKEQPDKKSHRKITSEQWERVKAAVDTKSLFALPDRIGCPGCVDEPIDWISVEYSDGTKKSVMCNSGGPPTDMAHKIKAELVQVASKGSSNRP